MKQQNFLDSKDVMAFCGMTGDTRFVKEVMDKLKIAPAYEHKYGRGGIRFYHAQDVTAARDSIIHELRLKLEPSAPAKKHIDHQFVPRQQMVDAINRLEAKIDVLIAMWEHK